MMFYQLPPAGNPITLKKTEKPLDELGQLLGAPRLRLYGSGTSALAAALKAILSVKQYEKPEVLLPAYTCPELVSAIIFSGATPVLLDLDPSCPWINLDDLQRKITDCTVAVIAVNLFGIPERFEQIRSVIRNRGIVLIEDGAQSFPASRRHIQWRGDMTILSFGRGKPVSLLGGGAVVCSESGFYRYLPVADSDSSLDNAGLMADLLFRGKSIAYNMLLSPRSYWLPESLPFLHLGETVYHPLTAITPFPSPALAYLPANIRAYWRRQATSINSEQLLPPLLKQALTDVPATCCGSEMPPLIRYPFLARTREQANTLYAESKTHGLGVSRMYQKPLNIIPGLVDMFKDQGPFPNASRFADLLLTFPTHSGVVSGYAKYWEKFHVNET